MKRTRIITLTTDFGHGSHYVAALKGSILSIADDVLLVDATHGIAPQNVLQGALALREFSGTFPAGSIHCVVVDPGVGTNREIILVEQNGQYFIGPNNGVLTFAISNAKSIRRVDQSEFWGNEISRTFHGRDIMGPVAAHLSLGVSAEQLSSEMNSQPITLTVPRPTWGTDSKSTSNLSEPNDLGVLEGEVLWVDSFGNLITNISSQDVLKFERFDVLFAGQRIPFVTTYGAAEPGQLICLIGSSNWLEVAVCNGNAERAVAADFALARRVRVIERFA